MTSNGFKIFCMTNDLLARVWDGKVVIIIKRNITGEVENLS